MAGADATPPLLEVRGLSHGFSGARALSGVDLCLRPGEVLGLIGPNGGGKSTLLLLMAGLLRPRMGEVRVAGRPPSERARRAEGTVGLITAEAGLYPLLTGRENLRFFGGLNGISPAEVEARIAPFLEPLQLGPALDRTVGEGSSGMRQKLSLLRALLMRPRLLLLDEPTANLDPVSARAIWTLVRLQADQGLAVVVATHDLLAAESLCDRVLLLQGQIVEELAFPRPRAPPPVSRLFEPYLRLMPPTAVSPSPASVPPARASLPGVLALVAGQSLREQLRQPMMLLSMALVVGSIAGTVLFVAGTLALVESQPASRALFRANLETAGLGLSDPIPTVMELLLGTFNFLLVTQLLGMAAVLAAQSLLHERQCGTLPFLLLAPAGRLGIFFGRVLGAVILPVLLTWTLGGGTALLLSGLDLCAPWAWRLPPSPGWLLSILVGAPLWTLVLAAAASLLSLRARDVRTAQQGSWLLVFLASTTIGSAIGGGLQEDARAQAALLLPGAVALGLLLLLGRRALGADLRR